MLNLSLWSHFKEGNDIEAVSVRKGCTFEGYDKTDRSGDKVTIRADKARDEHRDITGSLKNDISSMTCTCIN